MSVKKILQAIGRSAPYVDVFPPPILAQRAPSTSDNIPVGQLWVDQSVSPPIIYTSIGNGDFAEGGNEEATTTDFGIVQLATLSELQNGNAPAGAYVPTSNDVATVIAGVVVGAVPPATETTAGILEVATNAEMTTGTADDKIVTPVKLVTYLASAGVPGSFTTLDATGAVTFSSTGAIEMTSDTASFFDVTGAGIDLTLSSDAGRVIVNGEEAAANAITLLSAAGGIDVDAALQINISSSQNAVDAIRIVSSSGGIDIDAVGAATEDINITNTGASVVIVATESAADAIVLNATLGGIDILASGASAGEDIDIVATGSSVNITSTENNSGAILLTENGGASGRITLNAAQGTGADSINLDSTAGGITLSAALATADAINLSASAGGVDIDGALQVNIASSQNAADAIRIVASAGGIDVDAVGAAGEDISIVNTGGSLTLQATESDINAIVINASGAAGGINIDSGTSGIIVDTTGGISLDSAAASNFTATGAFDITINSTAGSVIINAEEAVTDAIDIQTAAGGIDVNAALEINIDSSEAAVADAIRIVASAADGGIDMDSGTGGFTIDSTGAISIDGAASSNFAVSGAGIDLTLDSASGQLILTGGEAAANAVRIQADNAAGGIDIDSGTGGITIDSTGVLSLDSAGATNLTATGAFDITVNSTAGSVNITAGEDAADAIVLTASAGGIDLAATGAAGQDIDITNTGGSINITATESVSDAIVINASGAAGGVTIDAGTNGFTLGTGIRYPVTSAATAGGTYTILNTDYLITTDSTGGAFQVNLPATPVSGMQFVVYDGAGQAAIGGNVTISGNGNNISASGTSAATKLINTAYESYILTWNGTLWLGQNVV